MLLWTNISVRGTKGNCHFGLQVSVPNPNSICASDVKNIDTYGQLSIREKSLTIDKKIENIDF